jgi:DNA mismatch repair protein MutS
VSSPAERSARRARRSCANTSPPSRRWATRFLFFRLGDFYEMFFEDAVNAARLLGLTLTSRNKQDPDPIPMCGIPWHQRDGYVARLLRLGHKVAICDQLEDPSQAKGIVQRGVTEVLTTGLGDGRCVPRGAANNYLAALWPRPDRLGLCLADASTGEMKLAECAWDEANALLRAREWPSGCCPTPLDDSVAPAWRLPLRACAGARSTLPVARWLDESRPPARWSQPSRTRHADLPLALSAAAAALDYLDRSQGGSALQMTRRRALERGAGAALRRRHRPAPRAVRTAAGRRGGAHALASREPRGHRRRFAAAAQLARTTAGSRRRSTSGKRPVAAWLGPKRARGSFREGLRGLPDLERLAARIACAQGDAARPRRAA